MSFHKDKYQRQTNIQYKRKEKDSFLIHHFVRKSHILSERASSFASRGSITLEAAVSASFFLFAILCLVYLFEIMALQTTIKSALHAVAKEVAQEAYVNPLIVPTEKIEERMMEIIGADRMEKSFLVEGCRGLDCSDSKKYWETTIMDLQVNYQVELPVGLFRIPILSKEEIVRIKGWTGHEMKTVDSSQQIMVYVTEYGIVYHGDLNCSFLELSLKTVELSEIGNLRNQSGGKYKKCTACESDKGEHSKVYITDYGDKYHNSLDCSKIKRAVYKIPLEDVKGIGGCSKCVK